MNASQIISNLKGFGFVPTRKLTDGMLLKSKTGAAIAFMDGTCEGIIPSVTTPSLVKENRFSKSVLSLVLIGVVITYFTTDVTIVVGNSMLPTYSNHEIIVNSRIVKTVENMLISRNCVVKFKSPSGGTCLKRVMGMPGDELEFQFRTIRINGKIVDTENSGLIDKLPSQGLGASVNAWAKQKTSLKLKPDEYFVMGDNRSASEDSRHFGAINRISIISVVQK